MDGHSSHPPQWTRPAMSQETGSLADLIEELQKAIRCGHTSSAVNLAKTLAEIRPTISAKLETDSSAAEQEMNLRVFICNKNSPVNDELSVVMNVKSSLTIEALKSMVFRKHGYHPDLQKWIVGKQIASDEDALGDLGINFDDAVAFLYIFTPSDSSGFKNAKKDHLPFMELNSPGSMNNAIPASISTPDLNLLREFSNQSQSSHLTREEEKIRWICPKCTFENKLAYSACEMCSENRPNYSESPYYSDMLNNLSQASNLHDQNTAGYDFVDSFTPTYGNG